MTAPAQLVEPIEILLVEDSDADVELTREVLRDTKIANRLSVVQDGDAAIAFVRREGRFADARRPDLILLDLNLPGKDGREVLEELKGDPEYRRIPIIVLTTSAEERDILRTYDAHVNAYVTKPIDLGAFIAVARAIDEFWLTIVRLPRTV